MHIHGPSHEASAHGLERYLGPSWLTQERKKGQFGSNWRRSVGQFWFISGRRVSHFGPRDGQFSPILAIFGAPRRPISIKLLTLTRPILVDTGAPKGSIRSNGRRSVGQFWFISGRRVSHFGPRDGRFSPILPILGAPRRPISVKVGTLTRPILVDTHSGYALGHTRGDGCSSSRKIPQSNSGLVPKCAGKHQIEKRIAIRSAHVLQHPRPPFPTFRNPQKPSLFCRRVTCQAFRVPPPLGPSIRSNDDTNPTIHAATT